MEVVWVLCEVEFVAEIAIVGSQVVVVIVVVEKEMIAELLCTENMQTVHIITPLQSGDGLLMRVRKKLRQDYGYRQEKGKVQKKKVIVFISSTICMYTILFLFCFHNIESITEFQ